MSFSSFFSFCSRKCLSVFYLMLNNLYSVYSENRGYSLSVCICVFQDENTGKHNGNKLQWNFL